MSILDDLAITTVTKTAKVSADQLRGKLGLPADSIVQIVAADDGSPLLLCSWLATEAPAAPEKPAPKKQKKEEPAAVPPAPVEVDWAAALKDGTRPTAVDIKRAEEEIGAVRVGEVRAKLSIGAGVTPSMIALQSNAKDYFDALRADVLGAK